LDQNQQPKAIVVTAPWKASAVFALGVAACGSVSAIRKGGEEEDLASVRADVKSGVIKLFERTGSVGRPPEIASFAVDRRGSWTMTSEQFGVSGWPVVEGAGILKKLARSAMT
jgi:hypothetical protein